MILKLALYDYIILSIEYVFFNIQMSIIFNIYLTNEKFIVQALGIKYAGITLYKQCILIVMLRHCDFWQKSLLSIKQTLIWNHPPLVLCVNSTYVQGTNTEASCLGLITLLVARFPSISSWEEHTADIYGIPSSSWFGTDGKHSIYRVEMLCTKTKKITTILLFPHLQFFSKN